MYVVKRDGRKEAVKFDKITFLALEEVQTISVKVFTSAVQLM